MNIDFANLPKAYQVYKSEFDEKIKSCRAESDFRKKDQIKSRKKNDPISVWYKKIQK